MIDLNKLNSFSNGILINNVANFYTATKPVARVDGSALAIGDKWFNPVTGVEGAFSGTYWLGENITIAINDLVLGGVSNLAFGRINTSELIFVKRFSSGFYTGTAFSSGNYVIHYLLDGNANIISTMSYENIANGLVQWRNRSIEVNQPVAQDGAANVGAILFQWNTIGSISNQFTYASLEVCKIL